MTLSRGIFLNMNEPDSQDVYNSVFTLVTVFLLEFLSKMKCWLGVNSKSSFLLLIFLKSASNLNGNLNCSKELEHYAS